jgi:hypothetical protein
MGFLDAIMSGAQGGQMQDFLQRYDQGPPWHGISDDEARGHYERVATAMSPDQYRDAAQAALAKLSPQERQALTQYMQQQARQQDVNFPGLHEQQAPHDAGALAGLFSSMHQQEPGLLQQLLGGGGGGALSNPIAKAALAGIAAMGIKKMMSG